MDPLVEPLQAQAAAAPRPAREAGWLTRRRHRYPAAVALLLLLLLGMGLYGAGGPFVWGHYGYHAGEYSTRARHTLRHGTILPSNSPGYTVPDRPSYYLHHPILTHQLVTLTLFVFGQREVAVRLAALLSAVACFLLLVALLRRRWGEWQSLLGGLLFILVPIHVWFAPHIDPGLPGIAGLLGFFLGYFPWVETGRWRYGLGALASLTLAFLFEWSPYLAIIPVGLHALVLAWRRRGRFLGWVGLLGLSGLVPLALHWAIVIGTGHLAEMRESYTLRSNGPSARDVLTGIGNGARELFGPPLCTAMVLWAILLVGRLGRRQLRLRDLLPVSFAFSLTVYVVLLRNGVLVHLYRLLYGGVLGAIAGVEVVEAVRGTFTPRLPDGQPSRRARLATAAVAVLLCVSSGFYAGQALLRSRQLGGVPLAHGYDPGLSARAFASRVLSLTTPADHVYVHQSLVIRKDLFFSLDRDLIPIGPIDDLRRRPPAEREHAVMVLVEPLRSPQEQAALADLLRRYPIYRIHEFSIVDLRRPGPPESHRERMLPPPPRSLWHRYWEGPYAHPELGPVTTPTPSK